MSERNVRKVDGCGNLGVHGDRVRFDVEMEVDGQVAGSVPIFVEIDKHFSKKDAEALRRILTDGRHRAIAAVYPKAVQPSRPPTAVSPSVKPAPPRRTKRLGLRFLKPRDGEVEAAEKAVKEGRDLPKRSVKRSARTLPPAQAAKASDAKSVEPPPKPKDPVTDLPARVKKPYVAPTVTELPATKPEVDDEAPTLPERPKKGRR